MVIGVSFEELSDFIEKGYGIDVAFSRVSDRELRLVYEQNLLIRKVKIPIDLRIENVTPSSLVVRYDGGLGVDLAVKGVLAFFRAKESELSDWLIAEEDNRIRIDLMNIPQTATALQYIGMENISVVENGLKISASLK